MKKNYIFIAFMFFTTLCNAQWTTVYPTEGGASVYFVDADTGYVVGGTTIANSGYVLKTTDGGDNWVKETTTGKGFRSVHFPTASTGYVVGWGGVMFKTSDYGTTWSQQWVVTDILKSVYFINADTGFVAGVMTGKILRTYDGGDNWTEYTSGIAVSTINSIHFPDATNGYMVGISGNVVKTTDGGASWSTSWNGVTTNELSSVFFTNADTGYAVGADGIIIKTTNGGTSWTQQTSVDQSTELYSVYFTDDNTGYIVGDWGLILKTTNGGDNWIQETSGILTKLNSVCFPTANTGFAAGSVILKNSPGTFVEENSQSKISIYPNPASDNIVISNTQNTTDKVLISILNFEGKLVKYNSFQNQDLIRLDVSTLAKGIYTLKVQSNDEIIIKKIVIQ